MANELNKRPRFEIGQLVIFGPKNRVGVISELTFIGAKCWFYSNNEKSSVPYELLLPISVNDTVEHKFENDYAKASLIERSLRVKEEEQIPEVIKQTDVRKEILELIERSNSNGEKDRRRKNTI